MHISYAKHTESHDNVSIFLIAAKSRKTPIYRYLMDIDIVI